MLSSHLTGSSLEWEGIPTTAPSGTKMGAGKVVLVNAGGEILSTIKDDAGNVVLKVVDAAPHGYDPDTDAMNVQGEVDVRGLYVDASVSDELLTVGDTYEESTCRMNLPGIHSFSVIVDTDVYMIENSSDPDTDLQDGTTAHFIRAGERLPFGIYTTAINTLDFRALSGNAKVRLSGAVLV